MTRNDFRGMLLRHEGLRLHPYQDHLGYWTIGVGRLIDARKGGGISQDEAMMLLENDIDKYESALIGSFPIVKMLDSVRYHVLLNMAFQMGIGGLAGFRRMWQAIANRDYQRAAEEMLDSRWHQQTPARAEELSEMMATGEYHP